MAPGTAGNESALPRAAEHRTVTRVMGILEAVVAAEPNGLRLGDLAEAVEAPKSSIHGLAKGLVATGYLSERSSRYFRGPAVTGLLGGNLPTLPSVYRHALEDLSKKLNETAILASLVGESVVHLDAVEASQMVRASPMLHHRRDLWPLSHGKCFLAYMPARRLDLYLRRHFAIADERDRVRAELEMVRESRVAINRGGSDEYGVASPIIIGGSDVVLSIGVAGPSFRMADRIDDIAKQVRATAESLSA
ncbi:IclR family transcriptional regulator [Arthrobacter sp. FW306-2-2C-D06B]|uniref:IclR family transcriptional regulator n=1 Tax=Arthrobacter sp. FW306-2-2C-D06B TaxID=2879618 RepID=UPI001F028523|nr:helix-turn-helix domain-containing protein [Arthrobacter sp. FW306-2-2C-D06B]UKA60495.1 helix-turn-helix domain-containing protein [Arthrobacter sp. FW306-2-2C-D06B]